MGRRSKNLYEVLWDGQYRGGRALNLLTAREVLDSPELRTIKTVLDNLGIGKQWIQYGSREWPKFSIDCINTSQCENHTQTHLGLQPVFGFEPLGPRLRLPGDPIADELGIS